MTSSILPTCVDLFRKEHVTFITLTWNRLEHIWIIRYNQTKWSMAKFLHFSHWNIMNILSIITNSQYLSFLSKYSQKMLRSTFLLWNGAFWDICLLHCGIWLSSYCNTKFSQDWFRHQAIIDYLLQSWSIINEVFWHSFEGSHRALMFSLICAWMNDWVNNREAGDLRHHRAHYDITLMKYKIFF